jgi:hypothetical protein
MAVELAGRPLPRPSDAAYVEARLLEALAEACLAVRLLREGLARNAALLSLELDRLRAIAKSDEERKWIESKAVPRVPTTKMRALTNTLEEAGHGVLTGTLLALELHNYQHHGPGPDMALSKYTTREEAAADVRRLAAEVARQAESLKGRVKWSDGLERALEELRRALPR